MTTALVTGGAGFIGSALVRHLTATGVRVVNVDKLTYAGSLDSLAALAGSPLHTHRKVDIIDRAALAAIFRAERPSCVYHLAAESHVDRSISDPSPFITTNVVGTHVLLAASLAYYQSLDPVARARFRFLHVSTDEVYGSLGPTGAFTEQSPYQPNNPYAASKAASDHLVRAWHHTYGLPTLITNGSNNFGPWQFPEKLVPVVLRNAMRGMPIPVYGSGENVRDWLYVDDHVSALEQVMARGRPGETYNVGSHNDRTNLALVQLLCDRLDALAPSLTVPRRRDLIAFVDDRLGHDFRYAIDPSKIEREIGWRPRASFEATLDATVRWYLEHVEWCERMEERARAR
jgi:dTDP-glucose 4,6-dehydratase